MKTIYLLILVFCVYAWANVFDVINPYVININDSLPSKYKNYEDTTHDKVTCGNPYINDLRKYLEQNAANISQPQQI